MQMQRRNPEGLIGGTFHSDEEDFSMIHEYPGGIVCASWLCGGSPLQQCRPVDNHCQRLRGGLRTGKHQESPATAAGFVWTAANTAAMTEKTGYRQPEELARRGRFYAVGSHFQTHYH